MRFITVVFLNFGPSLVGKLQVLKIPPWNKVRWIKILIYLRKERHTKLAAIKPSAMLVARR
jgi:hypothetical protein